MRNLLARLSVDPKEQLCGKSGKDKAGSGNQEFRGESEAGGEDRSRASMAASAQTTHHGSLVSSGRPHAGRIDPVAPPPPHSQPITACSPAAMDGRVEMGGTCLSGRPVCVEG